MLTAWGHGDSVPHFSKVARPHWVPVVSLAVPRPPGHVWSPGGKHVPALVELLSVGGRLCEPGHEAGPLVPAERLVQRARVPLRVTQPGPSGAQPVCLLISPLPSRP